jgi:hypothetical protein
MILLLLLLLPLLLLSLTLARTDRIIYVHADIHVVPLLLLLLHKLFSATHDASLHVTTVTHHSCARASWHTAAKLGVLCGQPDTTATM